MGFQEPAPAAATCNSQVRKHLENESIIPPSRGAATPIPAGMSAISRGSRPQADTPGDDGGIYPTPEGSHSYGVGSAQLARLFSARDDRLVRQRHHRREDIC